MAHLCYYVFGWVQVLVCVFVFALTCTYLLNWSAYFCWTGMGSRNLGWKLCDKVVWWDSLKSFHILNRFVSKGGSLETLQTPKALGNPEFGQLNYL